MLTLFQINVVVNSDSTGCTVEGIAEAVINDKWTCYTVYGHWGDPSRTYLYKIGSRYAIYFHYLISKLSSIRRLGLICTTKRLILKIKEIKPDLTHLHNIHGYYLNYPLLSDSLSESDIPVVWTLHDCQARTGHCTYYSDTDYDKWEQGCYGCPDLQDYSASLFYDHSRKNY